MKLSRSTRPSRPSFKVEDGKTHSVKKDSSRAREEYEVDNRDATLRYHDSREVMDSRRDSDENRDGERPSSDGSLDDEITFLSETDLREEPASSKKRTGWGKTKKFKGFPIIATIRKKIRRNKNRQNERNMNHLEILPEDNAASPDETPEPTQWQKFVDSVAFPENQIGRLYSNFVDYVSNHEKTTPETKIMDYEDFKSVVSERQQSDKGLLITDKQWENFMDTIAFPEKSIPALFAASSPTKTNTNTKTEESKKMTRALEIVENNSQEEDDDEEEEQQEEDIKRPVIVTMFKKSKFDGLGLRPQHLYGRTGIYIVEIIEGSKSAKTKLRTGMKILTINGKPCPDTVEKVVEKLSNLKGYVSIKAVQDAPYSVTSSAMDDIVFAMKYLLTGGGIVDGVDITTTKDTAVGESSTTSDVHGDESTIGTSTYQAAVAGAREDYSEYVDDDDTESSYETPPRVTTPNKSNTVAPAATPEKNATTAPPKRTVDEVDYVELARQKDKHYELVFDIKKRRGEWVGLSLMRNADWPGVYIERVDPRSKFANTQLARGMKLVAINRETCPEDLRQAIYKIFDVNGKLELTVEDSDGLYCNEEGSVIDTLSHDDFRENYGGFFVQSLRLDG